MSTFVKGDLTPCPDPLPGREGLQTLPPQGRTASMYPPPLIGGVQLQDVRIDWLRFVGPSYRLPSVISYLNSIFGPSKPSRGRYFYSDAQRWVGCVYAMFDSREDGVDHMTVEIPGSVIGQLPVDRAMVILRQFRSMGFRTARVDLPDVPVTAEMFLQPLVVLRHIDSKGRGILQVVEGAREALITKEARHHQRVAPVIARTDEDRGLETILWIPAEDKVRDGAPGAFHQFQPRAVSLDGLFVNHPHFGAGKNVHSSLHPSGWVNGVSGRLARFVIVRRLRSEDQCFCSLWVSMISISSMMSSIS